MEFVRRVYENSKVTIPKEIRELHHIETGDFVKLRVLEVIHQNGRAEPVERTEFFRVGENGVVE